jgi:fucose permease
VTSDGGTAPVRTAVRRDRSTWLTYAQVGLFGFYLYSFGPTIALLRDETGTTRAVASLHGTAMAVGAIAIGLAAPYVVRRTGRGRMMRLGSVLVASGLCVYVAGGSLALTLTGALIASAGGTFSLVGANAFMPEHQGAAGPQAMSEMHAVGAVTGLLGPIAVGVGVALAWGWRPAILTAAVAFVVLEVVRGGHLAPFDGTAEMAAAPHPVRAPLGRTFWLAFAVFACAAGTEFSLTFWGSDLLRDRAGLGEAAAAAAIGSIIGGVAVGRIVGSRVVARRDPEAVLAATFALTIVGFMIAWLSASAVPMLVGFAVTGIGMGLQSPLGIGRVVVAAGAQVDRGSGLASVAAGGASGIAPFVLGALADSIGVHLAFLIVPLLMAAALVLTRVAPVRLVGAGPVRQRR